MHGIFFNPPLESNYIGHIMAEIYKDGVYSRFFDGKKDLTVVDLGAHVGVFSYYVSQFSKVVYAVEPAQDSFDTLTRMIGFNKLENKIIPAKVAITNQPGEVKFYHNQFNNTLRSVMPVIQGQDKEPKEVVEAITIDKLFKDLKIKKVDFMKMDIEGSEFEVLGGDGFKKIAPQINAMVIESHDWAGRNHNQIRHSLQLNGFKVERIPNEATLWFAIK